jgi:hypothetical protein
MKFPKIFKEKETPLTAIERSDREYTQLRQLTADFMEGKISLAEYNRKSTNLCRIDLRALAQALHQ